MGGFGSESTLYMCTFNLYGHAVYHNIVYMFTTALIIIFYLNKLIHSSPQICDIEDSTGVISGSIVLITGLGTLQPAPV